MDEEKEVITTILRDNISQMLEWLEELPTYLLLQLLGNLLHYKEICNSENDIDEKVKLTCKRITVNKNLEKELEKFISKHVSAAKNTMKLGEIIGASREAKIIVKINLRSAELLTEHFLDCGINSIERLCIGLSHGLFIARCLL